MRFDGYIFKIHTQLKKKEKEIWEVLILNRNLLRYIPHLNDQICTWKMYIPYVFF